MPRKGPTSIDKKNKKPSPSGVFLLRSGLRPQFLGRALAALRSIGMEASLQLCDQAPNE